MLHSTEQFGDLRTLKPEAEDLSEAICHKWMGLIELDEHQALLFKRQDYMMMNEGWATVVGFSCP